MSQTIHPEHQGLLTEGPILKRLLIFSVPLLVGNLLQQLYNIVDAMVVGRFIGGYALAAVGASGNITFMLIGFFMGLTTGAGVLVSQYFGARDWSKLQQAIHSAAALTLIIGGIICVLGFALSPWLLRITATPLEVFDDALLYLRIIFAGMLPLLVYNMGAGLLRSVGDSKTPIYHLGVAVAINIVLDLLLVAVIPWGVAGAAIATVVAQVAAAALVVRRLLRADETYRFKWRQMRLVPGITRRMVLISLPNGFQQTVVGLSNVVVQAFVNAQGPLVMAGFNAYGRLDGLVFLPVMSLSLAITVFAGQNIGAQQPERLRRGVKDCLISGLIYVVVAGALFIWASPQLLRMFSDDAQIIAYGVEMIYGMVPFYATLVVVFVLRGAINGAGYTMVTMMLSVGNFCLLRLVFLYFAQDTIVGIPLINLSYVLTWSSCALCMIVYYIKGRWRKALAQEEPAQAA